MHIMDFDIYITYEAKIQILELRDIDQLSTPDKIYLQLAIP